MRKWDINRALSFIRPTHKPTFSRHNTIEVKILTDKTIPNMRTTTIGKTTYNVNRTFGTRPIEDIMLEHMLANNPSSMAFDARPRL